MAGYRATRSVYSSYTATVNAAFEWLFPNTSAGRRTGALRSIENKTWKARLVVPVPTRRSPNHVVVAGRALYVLKQRFPAVASSRRGRSPWPDPRQRRIAVNLTVLPKLAVPIAVRRASQGTLRSRPWTAIGCEAAGEVRREECAHSNQDGYGGDPRVRTRMHRLEPTARAVLKALDPDLASFNLDTMAGEHEASRPRIGVWGCSPTWTTSRRLRPEAPTLPADQLHPWVWDAARTFWDAGAHAVAVEQAAKSITATPAEDRVPAGR